MTTNNNSYDFHVGDKAVRLQYDDRTKEHLDLGEPEEVVDVAHAQLQGQVRSVCGAIKLRKAGWVAANMVRLVHSNFVDGIK